MTRRTPPTEYRVTLEWVIEVTPGKDCRDALALARKKLLTEKGRAYCCRQKVGPYKRRKGE